MFIIGSRMRSSRQVLISVGDVDLFNAEWHVRSYNNLVLMFSYVASLKQPLLVVLMPY